LSNPKIQKSTAMIFAVLLASVLPTMLLTHSNMQLAVAQSVNQTSLSLSSSSSSSSSPVSSEGKSVATISVLKLPQEKQEYRNEVLQSWEGVADKVVKALSELI
jgi:guanyl-specific ribonuclease Sa